MTFPLKSSLFVCYLLLLKENSINSLKKFQKYIESVKYYFFEWVNLKIDVYKNHMFLIKFCDFKSKFKINHKENSNSHFHFLINEFIKHKNYSLYCRSKNVVENIINLLKINCLFLLKFDEKNQDLKFNFFPIFSKIQNLLKRSWVVLFIWFYFDCTA